MSRTGTATAPAGGEVTPGSLLGSYWRESEQPLASLLFILPLVLLYEVGTRFMVKGSADGSQQQIIASLLLRELFSFFGAKGRYLPGLAIFVILMASHILRRDRWAVRWETLLGMALECVVLSLPVIVLGMALAACFPMMARAGGRAADPSARSVQGDDQQAAPTDGVERPPPHMDPAPEGQTGQEGKLTNAAALAVGAGVYEEVVFRLILMTILSLILKDAFGMSPVTAGGIMILASGILFSAYHYLSPFEDFSWHSFVFRSLAGVYFAALFLTRGFGITAGSHAAYDLILAGLAAVR